MIYLQLFISFFKIGLLGFGGGMAIVSLIQTEVERYGWMSATEYLDILAISQMTPGPIGINAATYVGYTASGSVLGSLIATGSIILPSLLIMMVISALYFRISNRWAQNKIYQWVMVLIRAAVILLIAYACVKLIKPEAFIDAWSWMLFAVVFFFTLLPQFLPKKEVLSSKSQVSSSLASPCPLRGKGSGERGLFLHFLSHPIFLIVLCGFLGFCLYGCTPKSAEEKRCEQQVDSVMQTLSTRQKVAQITMVATTSYGDSAHQARLFDLIENEGLGGIILMHDSLARCRTYLSRLQHRARVPLLVAIDGEWGPAMRLAEFPFFPRQMQLGALPDDSLIYQMGLAVGRQCRELGIHINFAPVVDVNNNPDNVAINTRSFGESPERVAQYGSAYMRGMQDAGIFACAKHFPGHGDTDVDSHRALPTLPFSRQRLDSIELYPFRRLIRDGVSMVMLAHLHIPALDTAVSSVSRPIVTGLLKEELGFRGVVVTDALVMKGVAEGREPEEVMEMAYAAGVDMLLMPGRPKEGIERIAAKIDSGVYPLADLDQRVRKVLLMKARAGLLSATTPLPGGEDVSSADNGGASGVSSAGAVPLIRQIADRSLTLLKADSSVFPLPQKGRRMAYVAYGADYQPLRRFYGEVEGLSGFGGRSGVGPQTTVCYRCLQEACPDIAYEPLSRDWPAQRLSAELSRLRASYDLLILAFHDPSDRPHTALVPDSAHQEVFRTFAAPSARRSSPSPLLEGARWCPPLLGGEVALCAGEVSLFFGNPYALRDYPWLAAFHALLIGYADTEPNEQAAADILLGRTVPQGRLPVTAGSFPFGSGL